MRPLLSGGPSAKCPLLQNSSADTSPKGPPLRTAMQRRESSGGKHLMEPSAPQVNTFPPPAVSPRMSPVNRVVLATSLGMGQLASHCFRWLHPQLQGGDARGSGAGDANRREERPLCCCCSCRVLR